MNDKLVTLLPKVTLIVLLVLCVIVGAMFYLVGFDANSVEVAGDYLSDPQYTNLFMGFTYVLLGLAVLATLCSVVINFANKWATDKAGALKSLIIVALFALLLVVCWFLGSPEEVRILGYEGHDNVGFWAQFADATMFATYALLALTVLAIICGFVYNKIKD